MAAPKALRKKSLAERKSISDLTLHVNGKTKLTCQSGSRSVRVGVLNVVDDGREQQGSASAEDRREDNRGHPVCSAGRPGEWEEAQG
jgi:hypothetical protein